MPAADMEDRLAARLLGVDVDAEPTQIRGQFRRLAKAVHPDSSVLHGCVDLGRLAAAKDRLLQRAEQRRAVAERAAQLAAANARFVAAKAAREQALIEQDRICREAEAARKVAAMRAEPVGDVATRPAEGRPDLRPFQSVDRVGTLIDLAG